MKIIDCKTLRDDILKSIPNDKEAILDIFVTKDFGNADRSYIKSIKKAAEPFKINIRENSLYEDSYYNLICQSSKNQYIAMQELPNAIYKYLLVGKIQVDTIGKSYTDTTNLENQGKPIVVSAIIEVLNSLSKDYSRKDMLIIGRSDYAIILNSYSIKGMGFNTVTMCHSQTNDLKKYCQMADVIVSFAGKPNLIKGDMVKDGAVIISVGCSFVDGKLVGDIDMDSMKDKDVWVTPTPGGIGPLTTAITAREIFKK